jgi:hypothetical protein
MQGPIRNAKKFQELSSFNRLAKALIDACPEIEWELSFRSLGNQLGDLDRGKTTWWRNNPEKARFLAEFMELSLEDLGLHEKADRRAFPFPEFPELPPLDLKRDEIWWIATAKLDPIQVHKSWDGQSEPTLSDWLEDQPAWMRPPSGSHWLWVSDDLHRRLIASRLSARGIHDVVFCETLAAASDRLKNPRLLIVVPEQDGGEEDLAALADRPEGAGVLIISPVKWVPREQATSAELMSWESLTITGKERRRFQLTSKSNALGDVVQRWELKKLPDWRQRLLGWVERRLNRCSVDTLFSAEAVEDWIIKFDPAGQWFCTTSDLMQLCHLVHRDSEKRLPAPSDPQAGGRLVHLLFENESSARSYLIELLATLRWQSQLPWDGGLSSAEWQELAQSTGVTVSASDLREIVVGKTVGDRQRAADRVESLLATGNFPAILESGVLKAGKTGTYDFLHRAFVSLLLRDKLLAQVANDPLEDWALSCFDPTRRPIVDAALEVVPIDSLVKAANRLANEPLGSAQSIAAAEALFIAIGKRIAKRDSIPVALHKVVGLVIRHLDVSWEWSMADPWTRPVETNEEKLVWVCACWSWSLLPEAAVDGVPNWLFPGWAKELDEPPFWIYDLEPNQRTLDPSPAFRSLWEVLIEWVKEIDVPSDLWPGMIITAFLRKAAKGGLEAQSAWWKRVITQRWAVTLLRECCDEVGRDAATRLWPSFVAAEREVSIAPATEEADKLRVYDFFLHSRFWLLDCLPKAEVLRGLDRADLIYLARYPESLPPEVRADLLLAVKDSPPFEGAWEAEPFLERFGFQAAPALEYLLEHEVLGNAAASLLWRWSPERAVALLAEHGSVAPSVRSALYWQCTQEQFPRALALLSNDTKVFEQGERQLWVRKYLPYSGGHAVRALELLKSCNESPIDAHC